MLITVTLAVLVSQDKSADKKFYRFGPHDDFMLMGFAIDAGWKYFLVVFYSMINTVIRTIQHEVLSPWLVNNVQDIERELKPYIKKHAHEVTTVNTLYQWVDWLLYMNILLSQIDMVLVEIGMNIIATNVTTYLYMKYNVANKYVKLEEIPLKDIGLDSKDESITTA